MALILLFYFFYLVDYKCVELKENPLHSRVDQVFHPLARHHAAACEAIAKGHDAVEPYVQKVHGLLDEHVHSTKFFKDNKIEDKIETAKKQFHQVVDPVLAQVWQVVDSFEKVAYDHVEKAVGQGQQYFDKNIKPKVKKD